MPSLDLPAYSSAILASRAVTTKMSAIYGTVDGLVIGSALMFLRHHGAKDLITGVFHLDGLVNKPDLDELFDTSEYDTMHARIPGGARGGIAGTVSRVEPLALLHDRGAGWCSR